MTGMLNATRGYVWTDHFCVFLVPGVSLPKGGLPRSLTNGLVTVGDGIMMIETGTHTDDVEFTVQTHERQPPVEAEWEDVAEVSVVVPTGELHLLESRHPRVFPNLAWAGPGSYRVRVHATGRRSLDDDSGVTDRYLIQVWPAPQAPETLVRLCERSRRDLDAANARARGPQPVIPRPPGPPRPRPDQGPKSAPSRVNRTILRATNTPTAPGTESTDPLA